MTDTTKVKSVSMGHDAYNKLLIICEKEHRSLKHQLEKLVVEHYNQNYSNSKIGLNAVNV